MRGWMPEGSSARMRSTMLCRSARRAKSVSAAVRSPLHRPGQGRTASSPFWLQASAASEISAARRQRDS